MSKSPEAGTLYLVATPIGNLEDITLRALKILRTVGRIAAEDTRRTQTLLNHYDIRKPLISYHEHNERRRSVELIQILLAGEDVALVSDAGMPGISDPGYRIVQSALKEGIPLCAIPGPSAITTALSVSGLPTHRFSFFGFLPRPSGARQRLLKDIQRDPNTLIFYESPRRVQRTLEDMLEILGDRSAAIGRELTKRYEEVMRGRLSRLLETIRGRVLKGEFCILVSGWEVPSRTVKSPNLIKEIKEIQKRERSGLKEAVRKVANVYGVSKRDLYQLALTNSADGTTLLNKAAESETDKGTFSSTCMKRSNKT
jgi:16S rRNA (cytidine1402-2'-O)-methyltransferase